MTLLIFSVFLAGLFACRTDLKHHKIRNKDLAVFLLVGLTYYGILLARAIISKNEIVYNELIIAGANVLIAFVVSFIIRLVKIWPAGDAKMFVICCLLIPVFKYKHVYFKYFPGATLLMNIFIAGLIYLLAVAVIYLARETAETIKAKGGGAAAREFMASIFKKRIDLLKSYSSYIIVFLTMSTIYSFARESLRSILSLPPDLSIIILFLLMKPIGQFINDKFKMINHLMFYILYFIYLLSQTKLSFHAAGQLFLILAKNGTLFLVLYGTIRFLIEKYTSKTQLISVSRDSIMEGALPTAETTRFIMDEARGNTNIPAEGLTRENIELLKRRSAARDENITIYKPLPFAPIIFAGVIFTVVYGVSTVQIIKSLVFR